MSRSLWNETGPFFKPYFKYCRRYCYARWSPQSWIRAKRYTTSRRPWCSFSLCLSCEPHCLGSRLCHFFPVRSRPREVPRSTKGRPLRSSSCEIYSVDCGSHRNLETTQVEFSLWTQCTFLLSTFQGHTLGSRCKYKPFLIPPFCDTPYSFFLQVHAVPLYQRYLLFTLAFDFNWNVQYHHCIW